VTSPNEASYAYFLGGYDLEMLTIRELLDRHAPNRVHDSHLRWGARTSAYGAEIGDALEQGLTPVLIELEDDLGISASSEANRVLLIDHHGPLAGKERPTALEQLFDLLGRPRSEWTRWMDLVAANDRGHIRALTRIGASPEEIVQVRSADRAAQGITPEQDSTGRLAANQAESLLGGRLTVVRLSHDHSATVTDVLDPASGGPGYENLLVLCPTQTCFFGSGRGIRFLDAHFPAGYFGGELPERGFWGHSPALRSEDVLSVLGGALMTRPSSEIAVRIYHNILIWPVLLRGRPAGDSSKTATELHRWVGEFRNQGWKDSDGSEFGYEEIVYFHPFVRDFLFGDGKTSLEDLPFRMLKRTDIERVRVKLGKYAKGTRLELKIERLELYLGRPNTAILVVEVSNQLQEAPWDKSYQPLRTLAEALNFQDQFRRIYPPFWWASDDKQSDASDPGFCPLDVAWIREDRTVVELPKQFRCGSPREDFVDFTVPRLAPERNDEGSGQPQGATAQTLAQGMEAASMLGGKSDPPQEASGAEPPVFAHWRCFFGKIEPARNRSNLDADERTVDKQGNRRLFYQQIMDERIPAMSFFAVDDPGEVSQGDLDRITFYDAAGSDPYPYQEKFLADRRDRYTYNRFCNYKTTYVCSGYGFAVVGKYDADPGKEDPG
jgi:hypothetical protein